LEELLTGIIWDRRGFGGTKSGGDLRAGRPTGHLGGLGRDLGGSGARMAFRQTVWNRDAILVR